MNYFLNTLYHAHIQSYNIYFFRELSERYFIVKKNKNFFGLCNVWNSIT